MCVLGLKASQSPHMSEIEDGVEEETKLKSSHLHTNTTLEQHSKPRVNLLHILQQGWDLRSVWTLRIMGNELALTEATLSYGGISGFCRKDLSLIRCLSQLEGTTLPS